VFFPPLIALPNALREEYKAVIFPVRVQCLTLLTQLRAQTVGFGLRFSLREL
jgi:hypothetical protein